MHIPLHQFRLASKEDEESVLLFLEKYWNAEHIYVKHIPLFRYDLLVGNHLNFILAVNANNEIDGILGFILYSPALEGSDIFTVLWKVKPKNGDPMLGITLLTNLVEHYNFRTVSTVGANKKTLPLYEYSGYKVGQLQHYYLLNDQLTQFHIAANVVIPDPLPADKNILTAFSSFEALEEQFDIEKYKHRIPYKSPWYINKRYFNHPIYKYKVLGIRDSIIIAREVTIGESRILRIVDFIGLAEDLAYAGPSLRSILYQEAYEYIDFYQHGISHESMTAAGFSLKNDPDGIIIPNYFEPFVQENTSINFFTASTEEVFIFKGDGDQDRPNKVN
jgi:hypothetical protein